MKIALYIGTHAADGLPSRIGWYVTRRVQKGPYSDVTHVEAIHKENDDGTVVIASSSLRDHGVREKTVKLNPEHWMIVDVPGWDVQKSIELLDITRGLPYDLRGAMATVIPGTPSAEKWFCNEWVGFPYLKSSGNFSPNLFAAVCFSIGSNITKEFFMKNK